LRAYAIIGLAVSFVFLGCAVRQLPNDSFQLGERLYRVGRYSEAITQLSEFVAANPSDAKGHYMLADALYLQYAKDLPVGLADAKTLHVSLSHFSRALDIEPRHAEAYSQRGVVRLALGDVAGSKADYETALQIDPRLSRAYFNRGYWYELQQRYQEAIADYERFVALSDNDRWRGDTRKHIQELKLRILPKRPLDLGDLVL
jgi:tetratricopeptide (TPR) repeat protein